MNRVSTEVAQIELEKWMDHKRMKPSKREANESSLNKIREAIEEGSMTVNPETFELVYELQFPLGKDENIKELKFKPRLKLSAINPHMEKVDSSKSTSLIMAYICALTNQPKALLSDLDTEDYSIAQSVAVFFF